MKPVVTIITVVYNGELTLEKTIQSVINQSYENLEYIVIDGGSKDGTLDIIKKYQSNIDFWLSEEDNGIYDAMNKGIKMAKGEWINFMNSGDCFFNYEIVNDIFTHKIDKKYTFIYGDHEIFGKDLKEIAIARSLSTFWKGMPFCHQSLFARSQWMQENQFDSSGSIASDFNQLFNAYLNGFKFFYINKVVSCYNNDGVSQNSTKYWMEAWKIVRKSKSKFSHDLYFSILLFRIKIRSFLIFLLPKESFGKVINFKKGLKKIY